MTHCVHIQQHEKAANCSFTEPRILKIRSLAPDIEGFQKQKCIITTQYKLLNGIFPCNIKAIMGDFRCTLFFCDLFFRNRQSYVMSFMSSKRKVTYLEKFLNKFPKLAKTHCYKKSPLPLTKCKRKKFLFGIVCQVQDWRMAAI